MSGLRCDESRILLRGRAFDLAEVDCIRSDPCLLPRGNQLQWRRLSSSQLRRKIMARKYSKKASADVERAMKKRKAGTLKSGRSGKKVTSRKQAIAIGLSEARAEGKKVPKKATKRKKAAKKRKAKK
jgi:hypothetical protein